MYIHVEAADYNVCIDLSAEVVGGMAATVLTFILAVIVVAYLVGHPGNSDADYCL